MNETVEVVVYLKKDYSENESIWVDENLSMDEIIDLVDSAFEEWYYFDI